MSSGKELIAKDWTGRLWLYETIKELWAPEMERAFAQWANSHHGVPNEEKSE